MNNDLTIYDVIALPTYNAYAFSSALGDIMKEEGAQFILCSQDSGVTE